MCFAGSYKDDVARTDDFCKIVERYRAASGYHIENLIALVVSVQAS